MSKKAVLSVSFFLLFVVAAFASTKIVMDSLARDMVMRFVGSGQAVNTQDVSYEIYNTLRSQGKAIWDMRMKMSRPWALSLLFKNQAEPFMRHLRAYAHDAEMGKRQWQEMLSLYEKRLEAFSQAADLVLNNNIKLSKHIENVQKANKEVWKAYEKRDRLLLATRQKEAAKANLAFGIFLFKSMGYEIEPYYINDFFCLQPPREVAWLLRRHAEGGDDLVREYKALAKRARKLLKKYKNMY